MSTLPFSLIAFASAVAVLAARGPRSIRSQLVALAGLVILLLGVGIAGVISVALEDPAPMCLRPGGSDRFLCAPGDLALERATRFLLLDAPVVALAVLGGLLAMLTGLGDLILKGRAHLCRE